MSHTRLFWRLYLTYLIAVALCAGVVGWLAIDSASNLYHNQVTGDLKARAELVKREVATLVDDPSRLQAVVHDTGVGSDTRITVIAGPGDAPVTVGQVLADSNHDPATMENHNTPDREEVQAALGGGVGSMARWSPTLHQDMQYMAVPVLDDVGQVVAVVRTALPLTQLNRSLDAMIWRVVLGAIVVAIGVAIIGLVVSRQITDRMHVIQRGAERFAGGDFSHEIHESRVDEFGAVAVALNTMAHQLDTTIRTVTDERNQNAAVLRGMTEGVLAVDGGGRVLTMNAAAARLLGAGTDHAEGRVVEEVVRNPQLQTFVEAALSADEPIEGDLTVHVDGRPRSVQAHGARLEPANGEAPGAVIVLNDISRLREYEAIRRDFVANVSHEIKTPVTSIKGFAETLLDGALDDRDDSERFLRIIVGQADRLSAIIEDLLSLSNLETGEEGAAIVTERGDVHDVLQVALDVCGLKASAKGITLKLDCPDHLTAEMNPPLLEQAVVNLVDNAVKYSPSGSEVLVSAAQRPQGLTIAVSDHGVGIPREHLPRLFERFYRVDKARSRVLGGTGLGLSIVKHIAAAHGGGVTVESTPGAGSTFTIVLPA